MARPGSRAKSRFATQLPHPAETIGKEKSTVPTGEACRADRAQRAGAAQGRGTVCLRLRRRQPAATARGFSRPGGRFTAQPELVRRERADAQGPRTGGGRRGRRDADSGPQRGDLVNDALAEFLRHLALERNASELTIKAYREDLTQAIEFLQERPGEGALGPAQITSRHLRAF